MLVGIGLLVWGRVGRVVGFLGVMTTGWVVFASPAPLTSAPDGMKVSSGVSIGGRPTPCEGNML